LKIYILQGSVATQLRRGGMFNNHFRPTTNFLQKKNFENRLIFGEDMDNSLRLTFWATLYAIYILHFKNWTKLQDQKIQLPATSTNLACNAAIWWRV